jgi:hypothetical protein
MKIRFFFGLITKVINFDIWLKTQRGFSAIFNTCPTLVKNLLLFGPCSLGPIRGLDFAQFLALPDGAHYTCKTGV